jgi:CBS domain-containing protein
MATDFHSLNPDDPLTRALEHIYHGCQQDFPVIGSKGIEGVLTRMGILSVIHEKGVIVPVSEVMDRQFHSVDPRTPLDEVYQYLLSHNKTTMPVLENEKLRGMLSLDGISRYLMVQAALKGVQAA